LYFNLLDREFVAVLYANYDCGAVQFRTIRYRPVYSLVIHGLWPRWFFFCGL